MTHEGSGSAAEDMAGGKRHATPSLPILRQNFQEQTEVLESLLTIDEATESIADLRQWRRDAKKSVSQLATICKTLGKSLIRHGISAEATDKCTDFNIVRAKVQRTPQKKVYLS